MKQIKKNLKWITLAVVMIIIIGGVIIKWNLLTERSSNIITSNEVDLELQEVEEVKEEQILEITKVYVDIKGAVNNPGVYEIEENKKVIDVVSLAGGFTDVADTSMINLAKKVANEMVIIIYTVDEVKKAKKDSVAKVVDKQCICPQINNDACLQQNSNGDKQIASNEISKINLNSATLDELLTLSGIGESKAKAIIQYREENGKFNQIEDLMKVTGIGEALYEKIKDNITV